jgi:hypothetical protein
MQWANFCPPDPWILKEKIGRSHPRILREKIGHRGHGNAKQDTAMPNKTRQCQTRHGNAKQDTAMPNRTRQCQTGHGNAKQDTAMPNRTRQCQTGHGNAKQDTAMPCPYGWVCLWNNFRIPQIIRANIKVEPRLTVVEMAGVNHGSLMPS